MRRRHVAVLAALAWVAAFAACTLNPQPLPPRDDFSGASNSDEDGSSARSDSGAFNTGPEVPTSDAGATPTPAPPDADGKSDDGGDGGDGGDAGDGATDASDDGG